MKHTKTYRDCNANDIILVSGGLQCANCGAFEERSYYFLGLRDGKADRSLGNGALDTAIYSPLNEYAEGYKKGYYGKS